MTTLSEACRTAFVLESLENYVIADEPLSLLESARRADVAAAEQREGDEIIVFDDEHFWRQVLDNPDSSWGKQFLLAGTCYVSEWVARVPGNAVK